MRRFRSVEKWISGAVDRARRSYWGAMTPIWARQAQRGRERFCGKFVVVTGSCGKTTTTMLASRLIGAQAGTRATMVHNTPRWIFRLMRKLDHRIDYCIQETSEHPPGALRLVGEALHPDAVVITSIGTDHQTTFRTAEGTLAELREAVVTMSPGGVLCVSADEPLARQLAAAHPGRSVFFGSDASAEVRAVNIRSGLPDRLCFDLMVGDRTLAVRTRFLGTMMLSNVLAALALVHGIGLDLDKAVADLAEVEPLHERMSIREGQDGHTYLIDTRKAPFWSTLVMVEDLPRMSSGRRIFVLSEMSDLGPNESNKYRRVLRRASDNADLVVGIDRGGEAASRVRAIDPERTNVRSVASIDKLAELLRSEPPALVILKGNKFKVDGLFEDQSAKLAV